MPLSTSPTLLHPRPVPNSPYLNTQACASSGTPSPPLYGIESLDTNLASQYDQQLPPSSESELSESGYDVGVRSEEYMLQDTMYSDDDGEEGSDEMDMNEETMAKPEEPPETWLIWTEEMVDTGSEEEEAVDAQNS